jgi:hypothetical protein
MPENTLIISDYVTMQLMSPLSNKMLPTPRSFMIQTLSYDEQQTISYIKNMLSGYFNNITLWNTAQSDFWSAYAFGKGNIGVNIDYNKEMNNNTLRIEVTQGNYHCVGVRHIFDNKQDWREVAFIYFYWCGKNTGNEWQLIIAAPDDTNWFAFNFNDDFVGWRRIQIPLSQFGQVGHPDWKQVSYIAIRSFNPDPNNSWLLGEIGLCYLKALKLSKENIFYLIKKIDTADKRYCESVNIAWNQSNVLIILTSRTIKWLEQQDIAEIWFPPGESVDPKYLRLFQESNLLELIYSYETKIYIFRVKIELLNLLEP